MTFSTKYENGYALLELEPQSVATQLYFKFQLSVKVLGQNASQSYDFFVVNNKQVKSLALDYSQNQKPHQCKLTESQGETKLAQFFWSNFSTYAGLART